MSVFCRQLPTFRGVNVWSFKNPKVMSPWAVKNVRTAMDDKNKKKYQSLIEREASILSTIKHENIIGYRGLLNSTDGRQCLAMESCGRSLGDLIEERDEASHKPFSPKEILKVVHSVAKALNYLHTEKNLLHGDIKSYNILVKGDFEVVKLCDLGVCVQLNSQGQAELYTGTLIYNAPETLNESEEPQPVTGKAEIFSLGLVIWEMIALSPPHCEGIGDSSCDDSVASISSVSSMFADGKLGSRPDLPANLGPEYNKVVEIFMACTESDPDKRPSAAEVIALIEADLQDSNSTG